MTQLAGEATVERDVPFIWEALRTVSGLVVLLAVAVFTAAPMLLGDSETGSIPAADARSVALSTRPAKTVAVATPEPRPSFAFYLVATEEQVFTAERGEVDAVLNGYAWPDRQYAVLYARNEEEETLAGRAILQRMLTHSNATLVEVIDLRGVPATQ